MISKPWSNNIGLNKLLLHNIMDINEIPLWTALITPFSEDGNHIDFDDYKVLIKEQEAAGNGILLMGSTGEGLSLSIEERKEIVQFVHDLELKVPVMVGVGGVSHEASAEWIQWCNAYNIHAFLLTTPVYTKPGVQGQISWFKPLLDVSEKPCLFYNHPFRSGIPLHPEAVESLQHHPNFWAIKESSSSLEAYYNFRKCAPEIKLFCGEDNMFPFVKAFNISGLISVASNIWPEATATFVAQTLDAGMSPYVLDWYECTNALFTASNPIPTKRLAAMLGKIKSYTTRIPLSAEDLTDTSPLVAANEKVSSWEAQELELRETMSDCCITR